MLVGVRVRGPHSVRTGALKSSCDGMATGATRGSVLPTCLTTWNDRSMRASSFRCRAGNRQAASARAAASKSLRRLFLYLFLGPLGGRRRLRLPVFFLHCLDFGFVVLIS